MDPETRASYARGTQWHTEKFDSYDLTPLIDRFLQFTSGKRVLDLGCGAGRDAAVFRSKGCAVTGIDASPELFTVARQRLPGVDFRQCDFTEPLPFPAASFNGVWASASLLHLPKQQLPIVLREIKRVLSTGGIFFCSMKEGTGEKMLKDFSGEGKRFFAFYTEAELCHHVQAVGFTILGSERQEDSAYKRNAHLPKVEQWGIMVFAKKE